jgi:hypothetical protein
MCYWTTEGGWHLLLVEQAISLHVVSCITNELSGKVVMAAVNDRNERG